MFVHRPTLLERLSSPGSVEALQAVAAPQRGAGAALYACQGSAAEEPNEGQVQQTACGYAAQSQPFNYCHVGYTGSFFFGEMIKIIPGCQFKASSVLHQAAPHTE